MIDKKNQIYGLVDPRTSEVRYIGTTSEHRAKISAALKERAKKKQTRQEQEQEHV